MTNTSTHDTGKDVAVFREGIEILEGEKYRYAALGLFSEAEANQLDNVTVLVKQYLKRSKPGRPLCIAVFGAPGSGKSRLVKALPGLLGDEAETLAPLAEINLTQMTSVDNLTSALEDAKVAAGEKAPFVFFDEFDSKLDGAAWGWLYWFLAPMQDGVFHHLGKRNVLKRGVYIFAGGTASSFEDFGHTDRSMFAVAKGPDFVSRLRGYLDVAGVNADHNRGLRRAAVLRHQLHEHQKQVDSSLLEALLNVGRYKHGARSMEALVELMPSKRSAVIIDDISKHPLLGMHVDRGPLDLRTIGGNIGISCSEVEVAQAAPVLEALCGALISDGASLACGGRIPEHGLSQQLERIISASSERLERTAEPWIIVARWDEDPPLDKRIRQLIPPPRDEMDTPWREALRLFRMRHLLALRSVAQFAIGGRLVPQEPPLKKRYPGVAEELMLAIAMGHPVYISGALGGGAEWAGVLLGLGRCWTGPRPGFNEEWMDIPPGSAPLFRPPPLVDLPITRLDLMKFFQRHALGGPLWIENGLTTEENRSLFEAKEPDRIAALVQRGLRRRFALPTS